MYRFSRSIFRELSPHVAEDRPGEPGQRNRQQVLDACERAVRRLAYDRRYFARPARSLFEDIRIHFPLAEQRRVWRVVERNIGLAIEFLERLPADGFGIDGLPRQCHASTRKGRPCQRTPLPGHEYCPSHRHLEETFEAVDVERVGAAA